MKGLNIKRLCKQIKSDKNNLYWDFENGEHTITNRIWMIKLPELPREVKVTLLSIFGESPEEGRMVRIFGNGAPVHRDKAIDTSWIWSSLEGADPVRYTSFLKAVKGEYLRVLQGPSNFIFVLDKYLQVIDPDCGFENIKGTGSRKPIFFPDINYVVLPVRVFKEEPNLLSELLSK